MEMNKLDEIIANEAGKYYKIDPDDGAYTEKEVRQIALEFAKHILEEAAENAYVDSSYVQGCCMDSDDYTVNKQSITEVLNKYL